jgi:hypothetical protein
MKKLQLFFLLIVAGSVIFTSIFVTQKKITALKDDSWLKERMSYLPQTEKIKPYLLGFSSTFANYLWIKTMLYFGSHYETDKDYTWLVTMVDMVTKLNPYFYPAYEFAGVMLPAHSDDPEAARIILNRGITYLGISKYSLPFYLGWIYYDKYNSPGEAAQYLELAARSQNAPPFYSALAATLYTKAGKKDLALEFLYSAYYSSENPAVRKTLKYKIEELGGNLKVE